MFSVQKDLLIYFLIGCHSRIKTDCIFTKASQKTDLIFLDRETGYSCGCNGLIQALFLLTTFLASQKINLFCYNPKNISYAHFERSTVIVKEKNKARE